MNVIWPEPGKYLVAVSGGVDSMCLLDLLVKRGEYELVIAHVDHGIRQDSAKDTELVQKVANKNECNLVITKLDVAKQASEDQLRQARYGFLYAQMEQQRAAAILTAHHADDLLETSIMNVRRGTDRYGAAGGMTRKGIIRPLMNVTKKELLEYAKQQTIEWREDSTNSDARYTRNRVRHEVIPAIDATAYQRHLSSLVTLNQAIDDQLAGLVSVSGDRLSILRTVISRLSLREVEVLLAYALRQARPDIELSQPRVVEVARQIMLGTDKISFSISATDCIIIDIQ